MTTSIDPSVDELLLLEENQYHMPNFVFANIKPIGAERKIGHPTSSLSTQRSGYPMNMNFVSREIQGNNNSMNSFEIPSSTMSIYDHFPFSPIAESINPPTTNELESLTYHSFHNYSSSSASSTSDSSTTHSPRSPSHLLDNYIYQRQISSTALTQQKFHPSISGRVQTAKTIPSFCSTQTYPPSRFYVPHYSRNSFLNNYQQTRSTPPMFSAPVQCTRERFQVNSIGRPILRTNNYNHLSHVPHFKIRR